MGSLGGHALTGRPDGPGRHGPGRPATAAQRALDRIAARHREASLPGVELLSERARLRPSRATGPGPAAASFRVLRTVDGWVGLSLPRDSDRDLVPALVEARVTDPWSSVTSWAAGTSTAAAAGRIALLGLAGGSVPEPRAERAGTLVTAMGRRPRRQDPPLVVDLTSLWAGPLCARLLSSTGARVVKVESAARPDGARAGAPAFFDVLHRGHEQRRLDFATQLDDLRALLLRADLVLESSRSRALRQLGITAEEFVAAGTSWLSITARGRDSNTVGFGDDIAAAAGHVVPDGPDLLPVGDAIADPLAGLAAAAAAVDALASPEAVLIDVSMLHVAAEAM